LDRLATGNRHAEKSGAAALPARKRLCVTLTCVRIDHHFLSIRRRGSDEIAHFLRIYSYARGELLSVTKIKAAGPIAAGLDRVSFIIFCLSLGPGAPVFRGR
jgi:hypothetical protein